MAPTFRIDEAYLIGGWSSAALWGIFTSLVLIAVVQIVQMHAQGRMTRSKWITTIAMATLYCLSTVHAALELRRLVVGLIQIQGPGTVFYFGDIGQPLNRGKDLLYVTSMIIADAVVVWRCYVVWQSNKYVIAVPVLLFLGTITAGYGAVSQYFLTNPNPQEAVDFGNAMFAVSLTTNVVTTVLTVGRIWWQSRSLTRNLGKAYQSTYRTLVLVLIESGVVIAVAKLLEFILFQLASEDGLSGFNALYIVFDMIPQINGIMPTLIIITVNAGKTITDAHRLATSGVDTFRANGVSVHSSTMVFSSSGNTRQETSSSADGQTLFVGYKDDGYEYPEGIPLGIVGGKASTLDGSSKV
ncbi:hypothetical protein BDY19DRAFT_981050 [Irpex rosettiformis]|uniref:Uncharacterized protein n=1 Tax=Irpex rosettiformis TaxID=378272 RepID=A0ACB8TM46_9APHY|nr:hypothetical protein BDY19DRAFT_981050 [Irpex rosettiformis]